MYELSIKKIRNTLEFSWQLFLLCQQGCCFLGCPTLHTDPIYGDHSTCLYSSSTKQVEFNRYTLPPTYLSYNMEKILFELFIFPFGKIPLLTVWCPPPSPPSSKWPFFHFFCGQLKSIDQRKRNKKCRVTFFEILNFQVFF